MKLETIFSPIKTIEQIRGMVLEAINDLDLNSINLELQKMCISSGCDSVNVSQIEGITFVNSHQEQSSLGKNVLPINLNKLTDIDWRGIPDKDISFELKAYIIRQIVLWYREKITGRKGDSKFEYVVAEYISRSIIKSTGSEHRLLRFFEWTNQNAIVGFDMWLVALTKESKTGNSLLIKNSIIKAFLSGESFESQTFLEQLPEDTKLQFLELLRACNDATYYHEYEDYLFSKYNISSAELVAVRNDDSVESKAVLKSDEVKETVIEVFQEISWNEILTIHNEMLKRLGLSPIPADGCFPDFISFFSDVGHNTMAYIRHHNWEVDGNEIKFKFDDNTLKIKVNLDKLVRMFADAGDIDKPKNGLLDIFVHEFCHMLAQRPTQVLSEKLGADDNLVRGTGIDEDWYRYYRGGQKNELHEANMTRGTRLNEALTELGAQYIQNHYRPKNKDVHKERTQSGYVRYIDALGVLVLALHQESGVSVEVILKSFFHNYYGQNRIYSQDYLNGIVDEISDENTRDEILLAIYELFGSETTSLTDEYFENLARKFNVNIEQAKSIDQYM